MGVCLHFTHLRLVKIKTYHLWKDSIYSTVTRPLTCNGQGTLTSKQQLTKGDTPPTQCFVVGGAKCVGSNAALSKRLRSWIILLGNLVKGNVVVSYVIPRWSHHCYRQNWLKWRNDMLRKISNFFLFYLFIADTKSIVWTHTLCRTQVDKNRQYRT